VPPKYYIDICIMHIVMPYSEFYVSLDLCTALYVFYLLLVL